MKKMMITEDRMLETTAASPESDPLNGIIMIAAGGFYSDLQRSAHNRDGAELKKALKAQIKLLEGLYARI